MNNVWQIGNMTNLKLNTIKIMKFTGKHHFDNLPLTDKKCKFINKIKRQKILFIEK